MASKPKYNKTVIAQLQTIAATGRVTQEVGKPLLEMGAIQVNTNDVDASGAAAAILTDDAKAAIAPKGATGGEAATPSAFMIMSGIELPESKRGFGRQPGVSKYPLAEMGVGQFIFIPKSAEMDNPVKKLGSVVSNANNKYRTETGETRQVERTKRGPKNKAVLDDAGNKVKETVTVPVYKQTRKYVLRGVENGKQYGSFKASADGAVISRTE